ncbi:MAG TPA: HAD-IC family P-type ATPase, partial [Polyangiales bacterium]|nr:HAD-IC family P-type ATPase [Polyangiales bacterium]
MKGLTTAEARDALDRVGPNALPPERSRSLLSRVGAQLKSALLYLLLFALLADLFAWFMAGAQGMPLEALAIFCIVLLNASLGVLQEYRSERALRELSRLSAPRAWVERDGAFERLEATELVPGDLVRLEAGDQVPADGKLVSAEGLTVDESILTGESLPVDKVVGDELLSGSLLAHGRALLRVSRTGALSNMGKLATSLGRIDTAQTPLERRINELGRRIAHVVAALCAFIVIAGLIVQGLEHPLPILMFAVAFGVAVVPEGMPAMMTLTLALGVQRMARRQAVVRRLAAVEALGAVTVIASDKTGTLTENQLSVRTLDAAPALENDAL